MNKPHVYFFICMAVVITGCSKKIVSLPAPVVKPTLTIEEIDFEYLHGKMRLALRDADKEREIKANIRIRKDSVIWMTLNAVGIQVGKALINQDSITVVSSVKNEYFVFDYKELSARFNFKIDYRVIQAAMLGNLIMPRSETDVVHYDSAISVLSQSSGTITVANYINTPRMKLEKVEMKEESTHNSLTINYSNFQPVGNKTFPYNGTINLFYKTVSGLFNTTIIFEYNKLEVGDKELRFPFNIPKRYDRR